MSLGNSVKVFLGKIWNFPYKYFWDLITPPALATAYRTYGDKVGNKQSLSESWKTFHIAANRANNKTVVLLGVQDVFWDKSFWDDILKPYRVIFAIDWSGEYAGKNINNVPIVDPSRLLELSQRNNVVYLITATDKNSVDLAIDYLHDFGIESYFSYAALESHRLRYKIVKPAYRLWRLIYFIQHKDGFVPNILKFHFEMFLRWLKVPAAWEPYKQIETLKDRHKGRRCFIIGTGPSLCVEDLELLKGEITFGVNRLFRIYGDTDWRPTYYAMMDGKVVEQFFEDEFQMDLDTFCERESFIANQILEKVDDKISGSRIMSIPYSYLNLGVDAAHIWNMYQPNIAIGMYNMLSVVNNCINIAHYMGVAEIYLLGIDCNYMLPKQYFNDDKNWFATSVLRASINNHIGLQGFIFTKKCMDHYGVKVYNATRGGSLEVFPRVFLPDIVCHQNEKGKDVLVSIILPTYFCSHYIRETIESILMQKVSFPYEIIVGDDGSTDSTQAILLEYKRKYPEVFRLILRHENIGGSKNVYELFQMARGKYIAGIEGDDCWTDENKLQHQVDFLEENPTYSAVCHRMLVVDEYGKPIEKFNNKNILVWQHDYEVFTKEIFEQEILPGQASSMVFRNIFLSKKYDATILYRANNMICDRTIVLMLLNEGNIYCMQETFGKYTFVLKSTGTNATSIDAKRDDKLVIFFQYACNLEKYANEELHTSLSLRIRKDLLFERAVSQFYAKPSETTLWVIQEITNLSENIEEYKEKYILCREQFAYWKNRGRLKHFACGVKKIVSLPKRLLKFISYKWHSRLIEQNEQIILIEKKIFHLEQSRISQLMQNEKRLNANIAYLKYRLLKLEKDIEAIDSSSEKCTEQIIVNSDCSKQIIRYFNDCVTTVGEEEIAFLLRYYDFQTVLDIGSGEGKQSTLFCNSGKKVIAIDFDDSFCTKKLEHVAPYEFICADYNNYYFNEQFDCIWCCMVLEHQLNPGAFLQKIHSDLKEGGVLALIVSPSEKMIIGDRVFLWNTGFLIYNLVLSGFDCRDARIWSHDHSICIILEKKSIDISSLFVRNAEELKDLNPYLPAELEYHPHSLKVLFNGAVSKLNWFD